MAWDLVIGLEVHAQLNCKSKLFSGASTRFGAQANTQTAFIDAGLPGVLPVVNLEAVRMAIQFGLAINADINDLSFFERKNYFYPDLPKGYQISQFQSPIVSNGYLEIDAVNERKKVEIVRAHLEEDAGKSIHDAHLNYTGVDLNRAGTPLLEIVTSPCLYSIHEAIAYLKALHQLVRFLGICDGNMQEGSFRCDVNLSLKPAGSNQLGTRVELKNLNSFRFIEKAIIYEQARQQDLLESGNTLRQETRLFNPDTEMTYVLRTKENEQDYRYFPDPDLLPISLQELNLEEIKKDMPLLPWQIKQELSQKEGVTEEDIQFLLSSPEVYSFFSAICRQSTSAEKLIINWLKGPYLAALNAENSSFTKPPVPATVLAQLLNQLQQKTLSNNRAKQIFNQLWRKEDSLENLLAIEAENNQDNSGLEQFIQELVRNHQQQAEEYRQGKEKILSFFIGQVMKFSKGQADPEEVQGLLRHYLLQ